MGTKPKPRRKRRPGWKAATGDRTVLIDEKKRAFVVDEVYPGEFVETKLPDPPAEKGSMTKRIGSGPATKRRKRR